MKIIKTISLLVCMTLLSIPSFSQVSVSGKLNFMKVFGGWGSSPGAGFRGEYDIDGQKVIQFGFDYYTGSKFENTITGQSTSLTSYNTIEIPVEESLKFIHIQVGSKYYFVGDYEDDMNVYGAALVGLMLAPYTTTVGEYDKTQYYTYYTNEKETFTNFTINVGIGAEKKLGFGYLFADLNLILPANQMGGTEIETEIPASVSMDVGVRIPF